MICACVERLLLQIVVAAHGDEQESAHSGFCADAASEIPARPCAAARCRRRSRRADSRRRAAPALLRHRARSSPDSRRVRLLRENLAEIGVIFNEQEVGHHVTLRADLSRADDHPFVGRQFFQRHRTARVQFLRADGDLRAQAERAAVVEARAGVDEHRRRIDFLDEAIRVGAVLAS